MHRFAPGLAALILDLAASGIACAQAAAPATATTAAPALAPQTLAVDGYKVQMATAGSGRYTVLFESGFGSGMGGWRAVAPHLAASARILTYSRAGTGASDPRPAPLTILQSSEALDALLATARLGPPYILVGHSYGGLLARAFAARHPDWVAGMVLVDPADERFNPALRKLDAARAAADDKQFAAIVPAKFQPELQLLQPVLDSGVFPVAGKLPDVPVVVLTSVQQADKPEFFLQTPQAVAIKRDLHADFLRQFSAGSQVVTADSGHNIQQEQPELVIAAVKQVIAAADKRAGRN
jgi:pimeloyl-ACP methyl ester carboxylesterase